MPGPKSFVFCRGADIKFSALQSVCVCVLRSFVVPFKPLRLKRSTHTHTHIA